MIKLADLSKIYRLSRPTRTVNALNSITAEIESGRIVGILGPNGAGKTTLFKVLTGLLIPSSGTAEVLGYHPSDKRSRANIGYLPENFRMPKYFTPESALVLTAKLYSLPPKEIRRKVTQVLELVGLSEWRNVKVQKLSKGMKQRLGIGQAILPDCPVLLLDEPLDGLDAEGRRFFKQVLIRSRDAGHTILFCTHNFPDVEELCDELVILHRGKILKRGLTRTLLRTDSYVVTTSDPSGKHGDSIRIGQSDFVRDGTTYSSEVPTEQETHLLIAAAQDMGMRIVSVQSLKDNLEKLYFDIVRSSC